MTKWKGKFSWNQLISNQDGKTSGSGLIGVILGLIGACAFIFTMFGYWFNKPNTIEVMSKLIELIFAVTILLGVRKVGSFMRNRDNGNVETGANGENNDINNQENENYNPKNQD